MSWVLLIAGAVLIVAELVGVLITHRKEHTITYWVKRFWWLHAAMGGLIVWAGWHFYVDVGGWVDLAFVFMGLMVYGAVAWRRRGRRGT